MKKTDRQVLSLILVLGIGIVIGIFLSRGGDDYTPLYDADSMVVDDGYRPYPYKREERYQPGQSRERKAYQPYYQQEYQTVKLTPFDPNTADSTTLLQLGLSPWQVRNIYKYRAKGGVYRQPSDFARLYGLTQKKYDELRPYIHIDEAYTRPPVIENQETERPERDTVKYPIKLKPNEHIVLNTADTTQLKRVPGIGSGWARRIISYGERLGGYVDVVQLTELENFPHEALGYFVIENPTTKKINVNKLTLNQLRRHPYINFYQARAICDYRRLKGNLKSLDQLRLLSDFSPEVIERLTPYVEF